MLDRIQFDYDLGQSIVDVGHGYDPYNHVGDNVVAKVIDVVKVPRIVSPLFAVGTDLTSEPLSKEDVDSDLFGERPDVYRELLRCMMFDEAGTFKMDLHTAQAWSNDELA